MMSSIRLSRVGSIVALTFMMMMMMMMMMVDIVQQNTPLVVAAATTTDESILTSINSSNNNDESLQPQSQQQQIHPIKRRETSNNTNKNPPIEITKIEPIDAEHERRLLTCDDYQYRVKIRDELYMYYVASATTKRIKMKMEYLGQAWISFGTNEFGKGDMIGSEAWMALPLVPVSNSNPGTYMMTTETVAGVQLSPVQMLLDGTMEQTSESTTMSFSRNYVDWFQVNQPLNMTLNEFIWAYGISNVYNADVHEGAGHFGLKIEECTTPADAIIDVNKEKRRRCGLLRQSLFCPFGCGLLKRLVGLC